MKRAIVCLVAAVSLLFVLSPASATSYNLSGPYPQTVSPVPPVPGTNATLAATASGAFTMLDGTSGTVYEWVLNILSGDYAGTVAFVYQVQVTSGIVEHVTGSNFAGWLMEAESTFNCLICTGGLQNGVAPTSANSATGAIPSFNNSAGWGAGTWSEYMVIFTNANAFQPGTVGVIDGGGAQIAGYAPAVPEPATMSLLSIGLLGLGALSKKFKR